MQTLTPIVPFGDLRRRAKDVLAGLKEHPVVLTLRGRPRAVLMDYEAYDALVRRQQALEAARDAFLLQRAQETASGYQPLEALLRQHEELFAEQLHPPTAEQ
ncbi:MAG: type II toxin-antitoxin system Phd/YefM family antitoxin [Chloroflexi bacterium]|nr:type II toxin-antitoxin system Phd/YefM family antitoxin [Chloroflexota bacterium]